MNCIGVQLWLVYNVCDRVNEIIMVLIIALVHLMCMGPMTSESGSLDLVCSSPTEGMPSQE